MDQYGQPKIEKKKREQEQQHIASTHHAQISSTSILLSMQVLQPTMRCNGPQPRAAKHKQKKSRGVGESRSSVVAKLLDANRAALAEHSVSICTPTPTRNSLVARI